MVPKLEACAIGGCSLYILLDNVVDVAACPSGYSCTNDQCTSFISDRCNEMCDCTDCSDESNCTPLNGEINVLHFLIVYPCFKLLKTH